MKRVLLFILLSLSLLAGAQDRNIYRRTVGPYINRVRYDGGTEGSIDLNTKWAHLNEDYKNNLLLSIASFSGDKERVSGVYRYVSKSYDISTSKNDLTQSTALSQPYSVKIAPNEVNSFVNPNGGSSYLTHPAISFGATDKWTVEVTLNWSGNTAETRLIAGGTDGFIGLRGNTGRNILFRNESIVTGASATFFDPYCGKNSILTFTAIGNGIVSIYLNGVFSSNINIASNIILSRLIGSYFGKVYTYSIWNTNLSASEIARRASVIRSIIPDIESVQIGTQRWAVSNCQMVTTPQGTPIQEVQDNANVEKVTNAADRGFDSDTWWEKTDASITISGGTANFTSSPNNIDLRRSGLIVADKWYKITYTITSITSGGLRALAFWSSNGSNIGATHTSVGTYTEYLKASGTTFYINTVGVTTASIDNVSVQQVGWSDSQNLYDYIYANTAGTAEQKTYAACKAAGFWCHYNNDPANGVIYGKLYNWFAVKLMQMDIDYYNTANPTNRWGWHVPSQTDFTTLQTYLGGANVAGGKMKIPGTSYWNSPNTGANNSSGFSALGGGKRQGNTGSFDEYGVSSAYWTITESDTNNSIRCYPINTDATFTIGAQTKSRGYNIRLLHD